LVDEMGVCLSNLFREIGDSRLSRNISLPLGDRDTTIRVGTKSEVWIRRIWSKFEGSNEGVLIPSSCFLVLPAAGSYY
jgi:hypothetical protein